MPDLVKSVTIMLDKERKMRLDFNAMELFQEKTGLNPLTLGDRIMEPANLHALLWATLRDEDPQLAYEAVGRMMGPDNAVMIEEKLGEAFTVSTPAAEPGDKAASPQT